MSKEQINACKLFNVNIVDGFSLKINKSLEIVPCAQQNKLENFIEEVKKKNSYFFTFTQTFNK